MAIPFLNLFILCGAFIMTNIKSTILSSINSLLTTCFKWSHIDMNIMKSEDLHSNVFLFSFQTCICMHINNFVQLFLFTHEMTWEGYYWRMNAVYSVKCIHHCTCSYIIIISLFRKVPILGKHTKAITTAAWSSEVHCIMCVHVHIYYWWMEQAHLGWFL